MGSDLVRPLGFEPRTCGLRVGYRWDFVRTKKYKHARHGVCSNQVRTVKNPVIHRIYVLIYVLLF